MDELNIIYKDNFIVVVNKPAGLLSVPGRTPDKQDCVVNRIKDLFPDCMEFPSVHRLDMATSGLMVLALKKEVQRALSIDFQRHRILKEYQAIVAGSVKEDAGIIELAFRLDPENRPMQIYDQLNGKWGISRWAKLGKEGPFSRIEFYPITGRTHQLRLHSAHPLGLGFPIVGDPLYGQSKEGDRLLLHANRLEFFHPKTEKRLNFISEVEF